MHGVGEEGISAESFERLCSAYTSFFDHLARVGLAAGRVRAIERLVSLIDDESSDGVARLCTDILKARVDATSPPVEVGGDDDAPAVDESVIREALARLGEVEP